MDRVTQSLMRNYVGSAGLGALQDHEQFERFATHIILTRVQSTSFSADDYCVGDGVQGIDAFALVVNGELILDVDSLAVAIEESKSISVEIVAVQAKTSANFDLGAFSIFTDMVVALVTGTYDGSDPALRAIDDLVATLYEASDRFAANPIVRMYYVATGNWTPQESFLTKISATRQSLEASNMVSRVDCFVWGAAEVQKHWRSIDSGLETTFLFESKTTLPDIPGIQEAYLGILPAAELVKLVADEDGEIRKALFYDNVRDFQGDIDVNEDIRETLASEDRQKFCVLNNGVTLVAKSLRTTANRFTISDYQIVNGCQTSHVLFLERENLSNVHVPLRLIVTDDDELARSITTATNKQTQVSKENLLALKDEQKRIEEYFSAFQADEEHRIFYERRSKQWMGSQQIRGAWRVISLRNLMQSFGSMFLRIPHTAARYYPDLRDRADRDVFVDRHHPAYFYAAGYAYCKLDHFFRSQQIDRKFKPARYHLLAGVRVWFTGAKDADEIESRENRAERALRGFNQLLWSDTDYLNALKLVCAAIEAEAGGREITRDFGRNQEQTDSLFDAVLRLKVKEVALRS